MPPSFFGGWGGGGLGTPAFKPAAIPAPKPLPPPRINQPAAPPQMARGPYTGFRFMVDVSGVTVAEFNEVTGMEVKIKTEQIRQGGQNEFVHVLPGRLEYGNLVLKRGYITNSELYTWCMGMLNRQGKPIERRDVTVSLVAPNGKSLQTMFQWTFLGAYPVKWSGPAFKAGDNAVAMETLELAHEGLRA